MMETPAPTGPAEAPARTTISDPDPIGRRAQFLTTEHWSLLPPVR